MSKIGVSLKINVSAMDMARLFQGSKGQYLDATVFIDIDQLDQYGNSGMITQDVSKDEKVQGVKGNILGNCKVFWNDSGQVPQAQQQQGYQQPQQLQSPQGFQPQQQPGNVSSFNQAPPQPQQAGQAQQPQGQYQAPQQPPF